MSNHPIALVLIIQIAPGILLIAVWIRTKPRQSIGGALMPCNKWYPKIM